MYTELKVNLGDNYTEAAEDVRSRGGRLQPHRGV